MSTSASHRRLCSKSRKGTDESQDLVGEDCPEAPQRLLGHGDLVGGGVRAGVAWAQLAGLAEVGEHRVKPKAALERAGRALLLGMTADECGIRVDRGPLECRAEFSRARSCPCSSGAPLEHARLAGDLGDHAKHGGVRRDRAEQRRLVADRAQVGRAVAAAVGEHHPTAGSRMTRPGAWPPRRRRIPVSPLHSVRISPVFSATPANSAPPACATRPSFRSSRARSLSFSKPKNPCSGRQFSGPDHRGRNWLVHDPG